MIITVAGLKGGIGKTTTTAYLAHALAEADEAFAPFGGMFPPVHEHLRATLGS